MLAPLVSHFGIIFLVFRAGRLGRPSGSHLGGSLGGIWEVLGRIWEAFGGHVGGIWASLAKAKAKS